ncbi:hypothetical protein F4778DRAFT_773265 [Xylariomycetidae sp. FL2044]|nr:hypothetical protein F4778DRAFT_773265 [Xylariomycetidae sp. FL2044]
MFPDFPITRREDDGGQQQQPGGGPPYASPHASLGGLPQVVPDVIVCAVFMVMYIAFAITNMTILQINLHRRGHKFLFNGMLFGFSFARTVTLILRIVWATRPHNVRLAIAANIFLNAGILIVYVINLFFAQRILRAHQPPLGWDQRLRVALRVLLVVVACALIMTIVSIVLTSYTKNEYTLQACRDILLATSTYLLVFASLPIPVVLLANFLPPHPEREKFGKGTMRAKTDIVLLSSTLCIVIAGFKAGTNWEPPRDLDDPAWYHGTAAFYIFNFSLEIVVLCLLTFTRIDRRFHIPNGSSKPGDYSGLNTLRSIYVKTMRPPPAGSEGTLSHHAVVAPMREAYHRSSTSTYAFDSRVGLVR